ncbi:HEPN domain-containing protein [Schleiferiaceae bacterium]|nr:HEPN domain-containing protein [Schleiferiaceae bacterium]
MRYFQNKLSMPSKSYSNYQKNLKDVDRLIASHASESGTSPGKKGLGHLTRSGVVMLCAAFEVYIEELIEECIHKFIAEYPSLKEFPKQLKQRLAYVVKNQKNDLEVLNLIGNGWKDMLMNCLRSDLSTLNSPKFNKLDVLFNRYLGIKEFSLKWSCDRTELNHFISIRGEIAHNGAKAKYVQIKYLKKSREYINSLTQEIDNEISNHLAGILPKGNRPWRRRYE